MNRAHILLLDPDPVEAEQAQRAFREAGWEQRLHVVSDGEEAFAYLLGRGVYHDRFTYPQPRVILLGATKPDPAAIQVVQAVKQSQDLRRIPVVVLTRACDKTDLQHWYEVGVNSCLVKPSDFDDFLQLVRMCGAYWLSVNIIPPIPPYPQP
ncbi:MAG: response regulator [Caldilineae bacterium]|nr:MAG: response regulator [Caldilineae bacterium]